jgi:hypothetical protein
MHKQFFILFFLSGLMGKSQPPPGRTVNFSPPPVHNNFYKDADLAVVKDKYPPFASGSPYFNDDWWSADVELEHGETFRDVKMRLDLVDNTLQYVSPEGRELVASGAIKTVIFKDSTSGNKFKFINSSFLGMKKAKGAWLLELVSGRACFYKQILKSINEPKNYIPGGTEISINSAEEYFIYADSILLPVKKIKDVPGLLHYKFKEVNTFMNEHKLSGKSEPGFIELIKYYNSLF